MDDGLKMVTGMSLAYLTSFAGLVLAYISAVRRRKMERETCIEIREEPAEQDNKKDE